MEIAKVAGTTKASLYARFPSKEDVFRSVVLWTTERPDWPIPEPPLPDLDDLEQALRAIADAALHRAIHPSMVMLSRVAVSYESRFPELVLSTQVSE